MLYDVRVVRFIKTTSEAPINTNSTADYICLGHFDMMHISKLGNTTTTPLLEIQNDRDGMGESGFGCSENHVYSLYLLKDVSQEGRENLSDFWNCKTTYTVVTRIHCDYPTNWNQEKLPFSRIIEQYCRAQTKTSSRVVCRTTEGYNNIHVISFDSAVNDVGNPKTNVDCLFYDSLELGDTVSIMKSNSIAAILEVIRCLSSNICVRDTYTYCGIDRELLQKTSKAAVECVSEKAELAYISTRFSVRDIKNANVFFRELEHNTQSFAPQFYVTGTADRSIHWECTTEEQLIGILRALTKQGADVHDCFNDIITRIGIKQEISCDSNDKIEKKAVQSITSAIPCYQNTMAWLREEYKNCKSTNWKFTLLKLLGTLEAMYANYVMDDLADLIIPSVGAFLTRLNHLRDENNGIIADKYDDEIIEFLNHWTGLMNDIAQLESQLTQHPELSPVRYYIPALVLQFELRFVEYCCRALSIETCRSFVPMLLPVDSSDLYTYCPLDPGEDEYNLSCPLLVFVPFKDLYRPWETAFRVAHEISHYCEDPSRKRTERHNMLIDCAATYIVKRWYKMYIVPFFDDSNGELYNKSRDYIVDLVKNFSNNIDLAYPDEQWYLSKTLDVLSREAMDVIVSQRYLEQYLFMIYPEYFFKKKRDYSRIRGAMQHPIKCMGLQHDFENYLKLLEFLCGECYADIAMVLLTNCDFNDYFTSVFLDEYVRFTEREKDTEWLLQSPFVMRQVVRMGLVIQAISEVDGCKATWHPDNIKISQTNLIPLVQCALGIINQSTQDGSNKILTEVDVENPMIASVDDFKKIGKHLVECAKMIATELNDENSERYSPVRFVRNGISYVQNSAFDWNKVQQYIIN